MKSTFVDIHWQQIKENNGTGILVPTSEGEIDLHNLAAFYSLVYNVKDNSSTLIFQNKEGGGIIYGKPSITQVDFIFIDLKELHVEDIDRDMPRWEDETLDSFSLVEQTQNYISIVFEFRGGRRVFISADRLQCLLS